MARRGAHRLVGSSPHTRGTPRSAGTRTGGRGDHPRIRGEHCCLLASCINLTGIIPAYAGNTSVFAGRTKVPLESSPHTRGTRCRRSRGRRSSRDHPRIRGKHHVRRGADDVKDGIIPAYAGNTSTSRPPRFPNAGSSPHTRGTRAPGRCRGRLAGDHPRIRGEHFGLRA